MTALAIEPRRKDVRIISLIGIAHGTSHYYQLAFVTLLLIMRDRAGLSFEQIGLLGGVFYGVSGLAQTGAGFAVDRFGARPILAGGLATIGLAMALISTAHSFPAFATIAVVAGLGNSIFHPADFALINASVNPARLGRAFSIHGLGGSLGWAAAPAMYFLNDLLGPSGAALVGAIPGLVMASLIWLFRSDFSDHRESMRSKAAKVNDPSPLSLFTQGPILLCLGYFALVAAASVGIQQFAVPAWHSMFGVSESFAALSLVVFVVGSAAGVFVGGFFADRVRNHDRVAAFGLIAAAIFTVPVAMQSIPVLLLMPLLAAAGFSSGITGPSRDMIVRSTTPPGASGKVFGFVYSGLDVGSFLAPPVFGWLMSHGVPAMIFWIAVVLYLVNAGLVLLIRSVSVSPALPAAAE